MLGPKSQNTACRDYGVNDSVGVACPWRTNRNRSRRHGLRWRPHVRNGQDNDVAGSSQKRSVSTPSNERCRRLVDIKVSTMAAPDSNALHSRARVRACVSRECGGLLSRSLLAAAIIGGLPTIVSAQKTVDLRLPVVFSDGMVLQRNARIPVWGRAAPRTRVSVRLAGHGATSTADESGAWRVTLPSLAAGGPFELVVDAGPQRVTVHDVLVGDVWVASGQSNMEWTVAAANDAPHEIASAHDDRLRQFKVPNSWSWTPETELIGGNWTRADSQHVSAFSAVGYFFARELRREIKIPIGVINTSWGGSAIEAWISRGALGLGDSAWGAVQHRLQDQREDQNRIWEALRARIGSLPGIDSGTVDGRALWADPGLDDANWMELRVPGPWEEAGYAGLDGVAWYRTTITLTEAEVRQNARLSLGTVDDEDVTWVNGVEVGRTSVYNAPRVYTIPSSALRPGRNVIAVRVVDTGGEGGIIAEPSQVFFESEGGTRRSLAIPWKFKVAVVRMVENLRVNDIPAVLYNRMVHPIIPLPIAGVIWYQGESNAFNEAQAAAYRAQFATLITSWRREWNGGQRDLPFFWVQLPNFGAPDTIPPTNAAWAILRESQAAALSLPRTGQAVTIDIGNPSDIHPRNKQDVGRRLALAAEALAYGKRVEFSGPAYRAHTVRQNSVTVSFGHAGGGLVTRAGGDTVTCFAIAGADRRFVWARATIEGAKVIVWSPDVSQPVAVRYAWGNSPKNPCLYNHAGLPAAPFRTDSW